MTYYYYSAYSRAVDEFGASMGGAIVLTTVVLLVIVFYLATRAANLLWRVSRDHGDVRGFRIAVVVCLASWVTALLTWGLTGGGEDPHLASLAVSLTIIAGCCTLALLVVARYVELRADTLFQRERTRETLIKDVLTRSWWDDAA